MQMIGVENWNQYIQNGDRKLILTRENFFSTDSYENQEINGTKIRTVENFKYLGSIIQTVTTSDLIQNEV